MKQAISAEFYKTRKRRLTWIVLGVAPLVVIVLYALLFTAVASSRQDGGEAADWEARLSFANLVPFADAMVYRLVALLAIIFAGSMTANEFGWRTVVTFAAWTGDRRQLLAAKLVAVGVFVAVAAALGWAAVAAASLAGNLARGTFTAGDAGPGLLLDLPLAMAGTWLAALVYGVIAAAVAVATRSGAAAIGAPLGILLLEPLGSAALAALGGLGDGLAAFTLSANIDGLLAANGRVEGAGEDLSGYPPALQGIAFLVVSIVLTAWLAARALGRRDITE